MNNLTSSPPKSPAKVSVFMPVYNHAAFLHETIDSIISQDYNDFHLYIGDDASKDASPDIIRDFAARYPDKITYYINEKNLGVTANCNKLLGVCDGEYIAFTAGDDLFMPGKLKHQTRFMQENPNCAASYTNARIFGKGINNSLYYGRFPARRAHETKDGDISLFITQRNFLVGCTIMARRDCLPEGYFNPAIPTISDWLFFAEVGSTGDVLYIDKILSGYRRHASSITSRYLPISEFEKTYELLARKFPSYQNDISAGLARLYASYAGYHLLKGDPGRASQMIKNLFGILKKNWNLSFFILKCFVLDCFRYAYRLLKQGWSI